MWRTSFLHFTLAWQHFEPVDQRKPGFERHTCTQLVKNELLDTVLKEGLAALVSYHLTKVYEPDHPKITF